MRCRARLRLVTGRPNSVRFSTATICSTENYFFWENLFIQVGKSAKKTYTRTGPILPCQLRIAQVNFHQIDYTRLEIQSALAVQQSKRQGHRHEIRYVSQTSVGHHIDYL